MDAVLLAILGYVLAQLVIGAWVSRKIRNEEDYLVAGRRLGYGLATFSIFATWFGAETCIGAAGVVYDQGLSGGTADPFGYGLCILVMALFYAVPLWRLKLTTPADFFRQRFGGAVERLVVLLMIPTSLFWAAAQVRAFGQVLSASSGMTVDLAITMAALIVIVYTMFGGLLADAWTDVIQGIALMLGLVLLFAFVLKNAGTAPFASIPSERLGLFGGGEAPPLATIEHWAIPILGSVTAAELVTRCIAARSPTVARRSALGAGGLYILVGLIPVAIGLAGPTLLPGLNDPEHVLPRIARAYLPAFAYPVFAGAVVSAILSTVDSSLLVSASLLSHNIVLRLRPGMSETQKLRAARVAVVCFGGLATVMALRGEGVYALVEQASAFGSAGIFVTMTLGLFTRHGGSLAAQASLLTGVGTWCIGAYAGLWAYPYLTSVGAAALAFVLTAVVERARGVTVPP